MAVNLSLFEGVPSKRKKALEQFKELKRKEANRPFNKGRYLVLKTAKTGKYKGLAMNYIYETKPQGKFLKAYRFPKARR